MSRQLNIADWENSIIGKATGSCRWNSSKVDLSLQTNSRTIGSIISMGIIFKRCQKKKTART